jgi:hypothetical protein
VQWLSMAVIVLAAINAKWIHPNLALRLLKANLGLLENDCEIIELAPRQGLEEKCSAILSARPRILGLSVSIWNHVQTLELLKELDRTWKSSESSATTAPAGTPKRPVDEAKRPIIIFGGPEVSKIPEECEIMAFADFIIRGEGERAFAELCASILKGSIKPGSIKQQKYIDPQPVDLARIDPGYRLYTGEDLSRKLIYVEASRGCPFGCEFCLSSTENGVREFPLEEFLRNMDGLLDQALAFPKGQHPRTFKFLDRSFNVNIPRAVKIMEFFLARLQTHPSSCPTHPPAVRPGVPPFQVHFEMVPGNFPPELKEAIARFPPGSLRLEIGLQTLNPKTAALIKRAGYEGELENLRFLRSQTNAILHADLIAGLPGEDLASFAAGFDRLWIALSGTDCRTVDRGVEQKGETEFEIQLGILKCLPGTPLGRHSQSYGMVYAPEPPYELLESSALPRLELDRIKNFARFWELIVNRGVFADLIPQLLSPGKQVFCPFMELADGLFTRFGRNWGIDRKELREELENRIDLGPPTVSR